MIVTSDCWASPPACCLQPVPVSCQVAVSFLLSGLNTDTEVNCLAALSSQQPLNPLLVSSQAFI